MFKLSLGVHFYSKSPLQLAFTVAIVNLLITSDGVSTAESKESSRELPRTLVGPQEELLVGQTTFSVDDDEEPTFPVPAPNMVGVD